ncbi:hypothetical protein Tco_0717342 [Tanacetum coccineum]
MDMYYPRFTKVIVDYFMAKDQAIPRRKRCFWTMSDVTKDSKTQIWKKLMLILTTPKKKTATTAKGKRLKTSAKAAKPAKKKQPAKTSKAKGLTVLSEVALTEVYNEQLAHKNKSDRTHSSHEVGFSGLNEMMMMADDDDVDIIKDDDDQEDDGQDDINEQTDLDNNGDDFVHPKLSTQDQEVRHNEEESDEEIQGANVEEEELDEEETNDEDEANELYRDANVNLEGRDIEMTDTQQTNVQTTQVIEDTHVIITSVNPKDVLVTTIVEPPLLSTTTLPPPSTPLIIHLQQTLVPTPATAPSSSLQDLPNFGSLFWFDQRLKTLETDFSELKQTN